MFCCINVHTETPIATPVTESTLHHCTLTDKPQPTLTVNPQSSVFTGDTVTLICDVGQSTGWTIHWRKDSNTESTDAATKTIKSVSVSDGGRYQCRAKRGEYYSEFSNTAEITVKERPKPAVLVQPDKNVFKEETITLTCHIQETGDWQYSWYKDKNNITGQNQKHIIPSVASSHSGVYNCKATQSKAPTYSQMSDGVTLTVSGECVHLFLTSFQPKQTE
ncbi:hypothetical protein M9458_055484 [Cirrhinus mrigala]|uniref:Ig-like domain-containing protein n=1 Tax=Cirrhinus mrigala TaxID=683832 RepID=A0ABD0MJV8_CIRMR